MGAEVLGEGPRHTTTDTSTTAAELTEAYMCSVDVVALRNLMAEVGCFQEEPTMIYQDCSPAVQVAENRGSLAKRSKAGSGSPASGGVSESLSVEPNGYLKPPEMLSHLKGGKCHLGW